MPDRRRKRRGRRRPRRGSSFRISPVASAIAATFLAVAGVVALIVTTKSGSNQSICSLVIDRTSSTEHPLVTANYRFLANETVRECSAQNGTITIWVASPLGPKYIPAGPFPLYGVGKSKPIRDRDRLRQLKLAYAAVSRDLAIDGSSKSGGSNLVATIAQASRTEAQQAVQFGSSNNFMVILSDGMQLATGESVTSLASPSSNPQTLVTAVKLVNNFQMQGTKVFFYGADGPNTSTSGHQLPPWFITKVGIFWQDLITSNKATLCEYQTHQSVGSVIVPSCA